MTLSPCVMRADELWVLRVLLLVGRGVGQLRQIQGCGHTYSESR